MNILAHKNEIEESYWNVSYWKSNILKLDELDRHLFFNLEKVIKVNLFPNLRFILLFFQTKYNKLSRALQIGRYVQIDEMLEGAK